MQLHAAAFDELAEHYDASFTHTPVGAFLRQLVWARVEAFLGSSAQVLELGCGTGEDAVHLAQLGAEVIATDPSPAMIHIAQRKVQQHGWGARVQLHCMPAECVRASFAGRQFDAVFSNFGALNCIEHLPALVEDTRALLKPGARLLWVLLGRHVPWEWSWYLLHAQPRRAYRRLSGSTQWRGMCVRYPTPGELVRLLRPAFRIDAVRPLGAVLPPSYAAHWLERWPRLRPMLQRLEQRAQGSRLLARLADHYLIEATHLARPLPA